MPLDMKPACERCRLPLATDAGDARICSYECTFCVACAAGPLGGRCPNCGGELVPRPRRAPPTAATGAMEEPG